jgi:DnaK suppressor protein
MVDSSFQVAMQAQQMAEETARRSKLQLHKIEGALRRIEKDEYRSCFKCGNEIEDARLRIDPTNPRCMACMACMACME